MTHGHKASLVRVLFLVVLLALAGLPRALASAENQVDQAISASKSWVSQIDSGKYDDSYDFACEETRNRYPEEQWVEVLKTLRTPWGPVVNRQQLSHVYKPNGAYGLEGECMEITYSTKFKNYSNVTEQVVLKWQDGQWRGAAYFAGVATDPNAPASTPDNPTEIHTEPHVSAQPQQ